MITGDPGMGKTTFLRWIAHALSQPDIYGESIPNEVEGFIPILIRIADLADHIASCRGLEGQNRPTTVDSASWLAHYLGARSDASLWGLRSDDFKRILQTGRAIVLLDGLDEAPDRPARESMARLFEEASLVYGTSRFVVTTRPRSYEGLSILKDFCEVRIEPLTLVAIQTFLAHWCKGLLPHSPLQANTTLAELTEAMRARPEIRRMAKNPVMLTALAVVHWNEKRLPEQRAELYDSILTWLSRSRERRPGREPAERCLSILQELALSMQEETAGRRVVVGTGWAAEKLIAEFPNVTAATRFPSALAFLEREQVDSGIIVSRGGDTQFWHLTFQEHLAARAIAGRSDSNQYELLLRNGNIYRAEWREVVLLLAGILSLKQGRAKVDGLISELLRNLAPDANLTERARCVGLIGAIVYDLRPVLYSPIDPNYRLVLEDVLGIFDAQKSATVSFEVRLDAAEALGQAGDPSRLLKN
ncbi:MAG TPA: NACHT domain-containing protein [Terriglobales bacterium]|nr:NACHT domain-containing protein [Terriglobales bacterium]